MFFSPGVFKSLENSPTYVRFRVHLPGQANFVLACQVLESPHLEKFQLTLDPTILPAPGPPLPLRAPHGQQKRGGTYAGESAFDDVGHM